MSISLLMVQNSRLLVFISLWEAHGSSGNFTSLIYNSPRQLRVFVKRRNWGYINRGVSGVLPHETENYLEQVRNTHINDRRNLSLSSAIIGRLIIYFISESTIIDNQNV